jgi:hypothetical protein
MPQYNISVGLPSLPNGLKDKEAGMVSPLYRAVNALAQQVSLHTGNVQYSEAELDTLDQFTGLIDSREQRIYVKALEAIPYGGIVSLAMSSGRIGAWLADATVLTKPAHGVCDQVGGISLNSYGAVTFMRGKSVSITGTTLGATYYLSTAGTIQATSPTADGVLNQIVGIGLGSAGIYLNIEPVGQRVVRTYKTSTLNLRTQYTDGSFTDAMV